jgi:phage protein D
MAADYNLTVLDRLTNTMSIVALGEYDYLARRVITANFPLIDVDNSDWYIFSAEHNWSEQGYTTNLELRQ